MTMTKVTNDSTVTLESTLNAIEHWRNNKDAYQSKGIPQDIWKMVFELEDHGISNKLLKRIFSLNSQQYQSQRKKYLSTNPDNEATPNKLSDKTASSEIDFCEAKIIEASSADDIPTLNEAANHTAQVLDQLKSTSVNPCDFLNVKTIVVEYIRPDNHRLKIHTTTDSIAEVMLAFANLGNKN